MTLPRTPFIKHPLSGLLLPALLLAGCGGSSSTDFGGSSSASSSSIGNTPTAITIPFEAYAGTTAINCDATLEGLGTVSTQATIADFRFFVHDVRLITATGEELPVILDDTDLQADNIALLDFRDRLGSSADACQGDDNEYRNTHIVGEVELGAQDIAGIRFALGVPATHNHADQTAASGPLKNPGFATGMAWHWNVGYKFTGLDVFLDVPATRPDAPEWTNNRWNFHLGSTGCEGDATAGETVTCSHPNRIEIELDGFIPDTSVIRLDYAALVANSNLGEDLGGPAGCMSGAADPECAELFANLGASHPTQDDNATLEQKTFSIVNP